MSWSRSALCALWLLLSLKSVGADVMVFAAASLSDALKEVSTAYQKHSKERINFNFGASSALARQIQEGARADVFFSADEAKMDLLSGKDLIEKDTRKSLLSNSLVIVVPPDSSVTTPGDLRKLKRIALAQPDTVPAGIYARKYLEKVNLWREVKSRIVPTENVRAALAAVESGNADAAIVFKTDSAVSAKVKTAYEVPTGETPKISYSVAQLRESRAPAGARSFLQFLQSGESKRIFERFGFIVLPNAGTVNGNG